MACRWLETGIGPSLLQEESLQVAGAFESMFGDQLLQVGAWGDSSLFRRFGRTRRYAVVAPAAGPGVDLVSALDNLAIGDGAIDAVFLPHTLETADNPHAVLREVDRILRPDGRLVVAGFNSWGWWGMRHYLSRGRFPAGVRRMVSESRLRDWLQLLEFTTEPAKFHFVVPPLYHARGRAATSLKTRRWHPLAACYLLVARREVFMVTPIRPAFRRRAQLVGGLINPTTRNAA